MKPKEQAEIETRIQDLRQRYNRLKAICRYGAGISRNTIEEYAQEIEKLQAQLKA